MSPRNLRALLALLSCPTWGLVTTHSPRLSNDSLELINLLLRTTESTELRK